MKVTLEAIKHLRRAHTTAQEVFNYLTITINKTEIFTNDVKMKIISEVSDRKNVIQMEIQNASELLGINEYKNQRLNEISKSIATKVERLQTPPKYLCHRVPKQVCRLSIDAGFASGIHSVLWCFISAYYSNKTVIFLPEWDKYFHSAPDDNTSAQHWNDIFQPLSPSCDRKDLSPEELNAKPTPNTVIDRKLMNYLPKEFGSELMALVDSPNAWFHSQFIGYILRPQPRLELFLRDFKRQTNYRHPIVGIQVRRSDKLYYKEALYYSLTDYMIHAIDYFERLALTEEVTQRVVYIASDDPSVLTKFQFQYPDYEFIGSTSNAEIASLQTTRYSNESLWGVLQDIFMLSETDYIVCAFSSAICRLSFELMRYKRTDASFSYRSLDVPFHYHHSLTPIRTAFYNHKPKDYNQWKVKIGDRFHERIKGPRNLTEWFVQATNGRGWDSYFFASNSSENNFYQLYPIYKVYDDITLI